MKLKNHHLETHSETFDSELERPNNWKLYADHFFVPAYKFASTDQLDQQLETWNHVNKKLEFTESKSEMDGDLDMLLSNKADYSV